MMKRAAVLGVLCLLGLLGSLAALGDDRPQRQFANPLLDDVVAMTRAEVPDATILAYLRVRRARLESDVTARDLIDLRKAGVADTVVAYIASQSGVGEDTERTSPTSDAGVSGSAPDPARPDPPDPDAAKPEEPDPGDTGLIMGVYDPIPVGGYPCWPAWIAPYECGRPLPVSGGFVARWPDARRPPQSRRTDRSRTRDESADGKRASDSERSGRSGDRSAERDGGRGGSGTRGGGEREGRGSNGGQPRGGTGSGSSGRGSGGGPSRH